MRDPATEGARWLEQSENDLAFARHALDGAFHHQACFISQQCADKALKAVLYHRGARSVLGRSLVGLREKVAQGAADEWERLRDAAAELDLYYVATRYPNGLPEGAPHRAFTRRQAEGAIAHAAAFVAAARRATAATRAGCPGSSPCGRG